MLKEYMEHLILKKLNEDYTTPVKHHEHEYEMDYIHKDGRPTAKHNKSPKIFSPEEHKKHTDDFVAAARKKGFQAHVHTYHGAESPVRKQVRHSTIRVSHKDSDKANDFVNDHQHNSEVDPDDIDKYHKVKK
jgi:hypothetical protein